MRFLLKQINFYVILSSLAVSLTMGEREGVYKNKKSNAFSSPCNKKKVMLGVKNLVRHLIDKPLKLCHISLGRDVIKLLLQLVNLSL